MVRTHNLYGVAHLLPLPLLLLLLLRPRKWALLYHTHRA
jgi:hypothetical protein